MTNPRNGMKTFVFEGVDRLDLAPLRAAVREDHRTHIRACPPGIRCILGGPLRGPMEGMMIGTLLVFESDSAEQVEAFMAKDPYVQANLFETGVVREWTIGLGAIGSAETFCASAGGFAKAILAFRILVNRAVPRWSIVSRTRRPD
jgi:uncharacterized protein YciI